MIGKLRGPLSKLVGQAGFHSLLSRALALAKTANPALALVEVRIDGTLGGSGARRDPNGGVEPDTDVVAQLIGLLETFIGLTLAMRIIGDAWPELSATDGGEGNGERHE